MTKTILFTTLMVNYIEKNCGITKPRYSEHIGPSLYRGFTVPSIYVTANTSNMSVNFILLLPIKPLLLLVA